MKKLTRLLSIVLILSLCFSSMAFAVDVTDFKDVKSSDWFYPAVEYATLENLFAGTAIDTFSPNLTMTRGMFITVLGRLAGIPTTYGSTKSAVFQDVTQADYFYPYVTWANDNGIISGATATAFEPHKAIGREQIAVTLYLYFGICGIELAGRESVYDTFSDTGVVSAHAETAMRWATTYGVLNGSNGYINPQGSATRAEVAQFFLNFSRIKQYKAEDEPVESVMPDDVVDWETYNPVYEMPTGQSTIDADGGYYDYDLAKEIMLQINAMRVGYGVNELKFHPQIQQWASIRAKEHTIIHSYPNTAHIRPDGSPCLSVGVGLSSENLLWSNRYNASWRNDGEGFAELVITSWYNSTAGHKEAMLSPYSQLAAISCYVKGDYVYIAHLFSARTLYYYDFNI